MLPELIEERDAFDKKINDKIADMLEKAGMVLIDDVLEAKEVLGVSIAVEHLDQTYKALQILCGPPVGLRKEIARASSKPPRDRSDYDHGYLAGLWFALLGRGDDEN